MTRCCVRLLVAGLLLVSSVSAVSLHAQAMAGHNMGAMKEVPPPDQLPAPVPMTGIGNSHLTITATPEAQVWFNQGLNLYHDFWDYESARAFQQAVRVDPTCAMCYWGLGMALQFRGGQKAYSLKAFEMAGHLKGHGTPKEKLYIKAAQTKDKKAVNLYREIVKSDPADLQAKIFLANSLEDGFKDGEPKPGTAESIAIYTEILKASPDDSAANHYWIHAMEPTNHPERAISSAKLLASLAPASGHMVHMPGHIFYRTGDYAHAEGWFAKSTAVDEAYMRDQHVVVDDDWNYVHNLMYGIANLMEEGKLTEATALSGKLVAARGDSEATLYTWSARDSMSRLSPVLPVALRTGDWAKVLSLLATAKPDVKLENLAFLGGELRTFATGMNALDRGDLALAETSSKQLEADLAAKKNMPLPMKVEEPKKPVLPVKQAVMPDGGLKPITENLAIMSLELRAGILAAKKDVHGASLLFDEAAKLEKDLGYHEPPFFIRPVGETEGATMLRAKDPILAHAGYAAALVDRPNSGFGLYGLARSSEAAGKTSDALTEYAKFLDAWKDSDAGSAEMKHAAEYVAAHPVMASVGK